MDNHMTAILTAQDERHAANQPRLRFDVLEQKRRELSLPIARLCRASDISESAYHDLLKNQKRCPNFRTIGRLERGFQACAEVA
jgi:hypothetical protein